MSRVERNPKMVKYLDKWGNHDRNKSEQIRETYKAERQLRQPKKLFNDGVDHISKFINSIWREKVYAT